jgi:hypothetical protein
MFDLIHSMLWEEIEEEYSLNRNVEVSKNPEGKE